MLTGWIDVAQRSRLSGWAAAPGSDEPVELALSIMPSLMGAARPVDTILANMYRADRDTRNTGYEGRFGFDIDLTEYDLPAHTFVLDARAADTGARLPGAPVLIPAAGFGAVPDPFMLTEVDGRIMCRLPADVACCQAWHDGPCRVDLPAGTAGVVVCSPPRFMPGDRRRLGACLTRLSLDGEGCPLDSACLAFGFHDPEGEPGRQWRWMDDAAFIGIDPADGPRTLEFDVCGLPPAQPQPETRGEWRLHARFRFAGPQRGALPHVGGRFLMPPASPPIRRRAVRPPAVQS